MSTYLILNIGIVIIPLILSFDKKVHFYKKWKYAIPAILVPGLVFVIWDVWFTRIGVWSFNPAHLTGIDLFGIPIEEHMFFLTVPYACLFTYEVIKSYWPKINPLLLSKSFFSGLILVLGIVTAFFFDRLYTSVTFIALAICIVLIVFIINAKFSGRFLLVYFIIIFPFLITNGILTGTGLNEPVVLYNEVEIIGTRILTIPMEDSMYGMLLLLLNVFFFELLRKNV